jgi:hypothetical protein
MPSSDADWTDAETRVTRSSSENEAAGYIDVTATIVEACAVALHSPAHPQALSPSPTSNTASNIPVSMSDLEEIKVSDCGRHCIVIGLGSGVVRFVGLHPIKKKPRVGVEMNKQKGENDGSVKQYRYFSCRDGHGCITVPQKVKLFTETGALGSENTVNVTTVENEVFEGFQGC